MLGFVLFLLMFLTDSTMVNHHFSPQFPAYFFPRIRSISLGRGEVVDCLKNVHRLRENPTKIEADADGNWGCGVSKRQPQESGANSNEINEGTAVRECLCRDDEWTAKKKPLSAIAGYSSFEEFRYFETGGVTAIEDDLMSTPYAPRKFNGTCHTILEFHLSACPASSKTTIWYPRNLQ